MTVAEVERRLRAAGTAERRRVAKWYFPTKLRVFGVAVPELRRLARELAKTEPDAIKLARSLVKNGGFESRTLAYLVLERRRAALTARQVEALGRGNDNWATVDAFATLVAGPAWRDGRVSDAMVEKWARSRDRWWRRTALVSTVALKSDPERTLRMCAKLAADPDDMVVKAVSWALRELSKRQPELVRDFLERHRAVLHGRVLREVTSKLETGRKVRAARR